MTATQTPPTFSSADVCRQTGLTYRQLDRWCRQGWLQPRWRDPGGWSGGSGNLRLFDAAELDRARMMARLISLGVTAQQAAKVARDPTCRWGWLRKVTNAVEGWP